MQSYEVCISCGGNTGKGGASEDSLFLGDDAGVGPLCDACYDDVVKCVVRDSSENATLRARLYNAEEGLNFYKAFAWAPFGENGGIGLQKKLTWDACKAWEAKQEGKA